MQKKNRSVEEVENKINLEWMKWNKASGVVFFFDGKMPIRLKGRF